jgi:hypothetical protein
MYADAFSNKGVMPFNRKVVNGALAQFLFADDWPQVLVNINKAIVCS